MTRYSILCKHRRNGKTEIETVIVEGATAQDAWAKIGAVYGPTTSIHNTVPLPAEDVPKSHVVIAQPYEVITEWPDVSDATLQHVANTRLVVGGTDEWAAALDAQVAADRDDASPVVAVPKSKGGRPKGSKNKPTAIVGKPDRLKAMEERGIKLDPSLMPRDDPPTPTPAVPPPPPVRPRMPGEAAEPPGLRAQIEAAIRAGG